MPSNNSKYTEEMRQSYTLKHSMRCRLKKHIAVILHREKMVINEKVQNTVQKGKVENSLTITCGVCGVDVEKVRLLLASEW